MLRPRATLEEGVRIQLNLPALIKRFPLANRFRALTAGRLLIAVLLASIAAEDLLGLRQNGLVLDEDLGDLYAESMQT